jgi:hypothetical protein
VIRDEPAELKDFEKFVGALREILLLDDSVESRMKIIRAIVKKIKETPPSAMRAANRGIFSDK